MSLLGLVANVRIAGGPDRCIRICTQFLVASQSQIIGDNFIIIGGKFRVHILKSLILILGPQNVYTKRASQHWDGWQIRANGGCLD